MIRYTQVRGNMPIKIAHMHKKTFFLLTYPLFAWAEQGMVIVPVADLVGSPIKSFNIASTIEASYGSIPVCGGSSAPMKGCPRLQQLLFNEMVEIVKKEKNEICIKIPHLFYITHTDKKPQDTYWTSSKNIASLKSLEKYNINKAHLPQMASFKTRDMVKNQPTLALLHPFYDPGTDKVYSAGTQFVYDPDQSTSDSYAIFILDDMRHIMQLSFVPKTEVLIAGNTKKESIQQFLKILKIWAHGKNGFIPYVWGGASFIHSCKNNTFAEVPCALHKIHHFVRSECTKSPQTGFDCAGMISRAAQMAGIPYFFKNTYTLAHYLTPLLPEQELSPGDLIWIPGHVMVVSQLHPAKLIEARGYPHGFGLIHEIELYKVFKDMHTYQQLTDAFLNKKNLERLNKEGFPVETIKFFKLLTLNSAWSFKLAE